MEQLRHLLYGEGRGVRRDEADFFRTGLRTGSRTVCGRAARRPAMRPYRPPDLRVYGSTVAVEGEAEEEADGTTTEVSGTDDNGDTGDTEATADSAGTPGASGTPGI